MCIRDRIYTLLGSCVAITLWHPVRQIGGMCHYLLPRLQEQGQLPSLPVKPHARYADVAMALFEKAISRYRTNICEYQVKIFGGSNMVIKSEQAPGESVGDQNIQAAERLLEIRGMPIFVRHVGQTGHRRIIFDLQTGDVWVKHVPFDLTDTCRHG